MLTILVLTACAVVVGGGTAELIVMAIDAFTDWWTP